MVFHPYFFRLSLYFLVIVVILQVLANTFNWYYIFPKLDTPMHLLGGALVGFMALAYIPRDTTALAKLIWVIIWSIVIGIGVEFAEKLIDTYGHLGEKLQHGPLDTYTDIMHDFIGGALAFCYAYLRQKI